MGKRHSGGKLSQAAKDLANPKTPKKRKSEASAVLNEHKKKKH